MRTLFLLTVLATLLVIVIKKPDQTFWEVAHGLWEKIEGITSEVVEAPPVPPLTGTAGEDFAALRKHIHRAMEIDEGFGHPVHGELLAAGSKGGTDWYGTAKPDLSSPETSPMTKHKSATVRNAEAPTSSSGGEEILPAPQVADMPNLPAIPVVPVEVAEIGKGVTPPSRSRPQPTVSLNFGEVKAYYESASRLLAEIK